jgi:hypothetical protein
MCDDLQDIQSVEKQAKDNMVHPRCIVGNKPQRVAFEVFKRFQVHPKRD